MRLLSPTDKDFPVILSQNAAENIDFSFLGKIGQQSYLSKFLTSNPETLRFRQTLFRDIMENEKLIDFFDELDKKIYDIITFEQMGRQMRKDSENGDLLCSFRELKFFMDCIDLITAAKNEYSHITSPSLLAFFDRAKDISSQTWYMNTKSYINKLEESLREIRSITIGINLDAQLTPLEAGIVSINKKTFSTNSVFDKLFSKQEKDPHFICISPIASRELKNSGVSMQILNTKLYSAINSIVSGALKKIKNVLYDETHHAANFLIYLHDEIKFITCATTYILSIKAKGLPLCIPEISPKYEIKSLYNPNICSYIKSANIVKNDATFDNDGKIFILTGANSGGKSVYLRAIGAAQVLFQLGLPIPAKSAKMNICTEIFTQFGSKVTDKIGGRFENECKEVLKIYKEVTENSLVLFDELFASTNAYEGAIIAAKVLKRFAVVGAKCLYTTHMHDLAEKIDEINSIPNIKSHADTLCAEIHDGVCTYKILRKRESAGSYAEEIFKKYGFEEI